MENETVKQYMNVDRLCDELYEILKGERDGFIEDDNRDFLMSEFSDEIIRDRTEEMAYQIDRDMGKYLNLPSHKIDGNFNNIDYDYPLHIYGVVEYNIPMVSAMIERLNNGEVSKQADADRDWLVDWFWETFGSFGIKYNFDTEISDRLYEHEHNEDNDYE